MHTLGKSIPKIGTTFVFFGKLPQVNNRLLGKNWPNLVTVVPGLPDFSWYNIPE
jgi:hypothetical protein